MGGRIFENTRRVTKDDVKEVIARIESKKFSDFDVFAVIGSWNNLSAMNRETMGDLDIVYCSYQPQQSGFEMTSEDLAKYVFDEIEELKKGSNDTIFIKRKGIQIDFTVVFSREHFQWITKASTVPKYDSWKPLYRNEILFHLPRYLTINRVEVNHENRVTSYFRDRFTIFDGVHTSKYSFPRTRPVREDQRRSFDFDTFLKTSCGLPNGVVSNPTFLNIIEAASKEPYWNRLCEDLTRAFKKKGVAIPKVILEP